MASRSQRQQGTRSALGSREHAPVDAVILTQTPDLQNAENKCALFVATRLVAAGNELGAPLPLTGRYLVV